MRIFASLFLTGTVLFQGVTARAAEVESRVLTHYVPQDLLETAVRTEGWTEIPLVLKSGLRKGDVVRVWAGGSIDRGNGDLPGQNTGGPDGPAADNGLKPALRTQNEKLALSQDSRLAFALLFKTEQPGMLAAPHAGKPLEIKLAKDGEKVWAGFNDERGKYNDNHLGKGRRHELDPLWVRIEVVRVIVD